MTPSTERNVDSSQWLPAGAPRPVRRGRARASLAHRQGAAHAAHEGGLRRTLRLAPGRAVDRACSAPRTKRAAGARTAPPCSARSSCAAAVTSGCLRRSVIPDSTLCLHPWLGEFGDSSLGETLARTLRRRAQLVTSTRGCPLENELAARALREAQLAPAGLWARRSRIQLRGAPLLVQELFLPAMGRI